MTNMHKTTDERFERVFDYMETHDAPRQKLFFEGRVYDAFELLVQLIQCASHVKYAGKKSFAVACIEDTLTIQIFLERLAQ